MASCIKSTAPKAKLGATMIPVPCSLAPISNLARSPSLRPLLPMTELTPRLLAKRAAETPAEALVKSTITWGAVDPNRSPRLVVRGMVAGTIRKE